jgi:TRAP-type C4-dicarboxylate transport system substrate-binding protein
MTRATPPRALRVALCIPLVLLLTGSADPDPSPRKPIVIKLATLAPNGSPWHEILKDMAAQWAEASDGQVTLRIYPDGVAGEEPDVLRKMRIGQLHAGGLTYAGLSRVVPEVTVLAIPMAIDSAEDLRRVREVMEPRLERLFEERGFVLLNWGDVGWVRFFLPNAEASIAAIKRLKHIAWSDDVTTDMWRAAGFQMITLTLPDILPGLQTRMVNAIASTPLVLLSNQWFPYLPYMLDMPWAPLIGATLVDRRTWQRIPEDLRTELRRIARATTERLTTEVVRMEEAAIAAMKERGLQVIEPEEELVAQWRALMQTAYPKLRGSIIPEEWFDEALRIVGGGG